MFGSFMAVEGQESEDGTNECWSQVMRSRWCVTILERSRQVLQVARTAGSPWSRQYRGRHPCVSPSLVRM